MRKVHKDIYVGIAFLVLGIVFLLLTKEMPEAAASFPRLIFYGIIILSSVLIVFGIAKTVRMNRIGEEVSGISVAQLKFPIFVAGMTFAFIFGIWKLGFYFSTAIFIPAMMLLFGERSVKRIVITTVVTMVCVFLIFSLLLGVRMPRALLI